MDDSTIRIGISSCLLGEEVRFDGSHKRDRYLSDTLGEYFTWVPVCPEVELGLGTPRETIQLRQADDGSTRLITTSTQVDLTLAMQRYATRRAEALAEQPLSGYILKRSSPSCGMERVKIYSGQAAPRRTGRGVFAAALMDRFPDLPVEEEGRLSDPKLRENWIERVFAYHAYQQLFAGRWTLADVVRFHTHYKFVLLAHSEAEYRRLGRLVADAKSIPRHALRQEYQHHFMAGMRKIATPRKNANVLQHMFGFFKKQLDRASRDEVLQHIEDYRQGLVPLVVPLTVLRHYVRVFAVEYLADQVYLNPHPKELALRNHV